MLSGVLPILLIHALLIGCAGDDDDGFGRAINHGDDSVDTDTTEPEDTGPGWDTSLDDGGGSDDTFNAVWVRCEDGGATWTFHAELNYAARHVGTTRYERWYLRAQSEERLLWEVTVPNSLSSNTCEETVPLLWTATGATAWAVTYESEYTPP